MSTQVVSSANGASKVPEALERPLVDYRRRLRILKVAEVLSAAVAGLVLVFLIVFSIERVVAIPKTIRILMLVMGTLGFTIALPMVWRKWVWNTRHLTQVAKRLRRAFPVLGDEILSVIEMMHQRTGRGASPHLIAEAAKQTCVRVGLHDLNTAAPSGRAQKWACLALLIIGVAAGVMVAWPRAATNSWARFLRPWSETPRFTFTRMAELPGQIVVPYGESFPLDVFLERESDSRPEIASAEVGGKSASAPLENERYRFSIPAQIIEAEIRVAAGDDEQAVGVIPMTRPELTSITTRTTLPAYLGYPEALEETSSSRRLRALEGSTVEFSFRANRDLKTATLDGHRVTVEGSVVSTAPFVVQDSSRHVLDWEDVHQLKPAQPIELRVNAMSDQAPSVVFERLKDRVLLESKSLRFEFSGRDDFGIRAIGLEWEGQGRGEDNTSPTRGEKILFAGGPQEKAIDGQGILTPRMEGINPQVLTLRLFVEDDLPSRGRIYSRPQILHVMSDDEHVAWVNERMQRWKSTADAIYEQEVGLAEENRQLRELDRKEQVLPENLRRMENQVAAERANAKRLGAAVDEGRDLIEQALMNKNLRAQQVKKWADALARLQAIAERGMPMLADQLNEVQENLSRGELGQDQVASDGQKGREPSPSTPPAEPPEALAGKARPDLRVDGKSDDPDMEGEGESSEGQAPTLRDVEDSTLKPSESDNGKGGAGKTNLDLPATSLLNPQDQGEQGAGQESAEPGTEEPAEPTLDDVVEDHEKLLEEFKKARDEMDEIVDDFENSTFVKRFKAAARRQLGMASRLNQLMAGGFGQQHPQRGRASTELAALSKSQRGLFEDLGRLKADLEAYQAREPEEARQAILEEMGALKMQVKLEELPKRLQRNRLGDSLHRSEYWADTFDRWAEELVPPARPGGGGGGGEDPSLPPAIVLDVMRQIEDEMNLRDETRSLNLSRAALSQEELQERKDGLTVHQMAIQERSLDTIEDIKKLPNGASAFGEQIAKVQKGATAMGEASGMLFDGTTGEPTVAAETAAIEALLESKRVSPPSSDSDPGSNNSGTDGSESFANGKSAMERIGPGGSRSLRITPRDVGAGTSATINKVPERFREGVDSFTNKLGRLRRTKNR